MPKMPSQDHPDGKYAEFVRQVFSGTPRAEAFICTCCWNPLKDCSCGTKDKLIEFFEVKRSEGAITP